MAEGDAGGGAGGGAAPWYQGVTGVDPEMVGHWTNKGWHTKTAAEVALEATKAWKAAEGFVGVPASQLLRLPKDATDEAGWNAVWSRLGKPADAKEYDFTPIKRADGSALAEDMQAFLREQAFKLNLPKDKALEFASEFTKRQDGAQTSESVERAAKLVTEKTELAKNWGPNFEANKFVAQRAAQALGVDPETVAALENQLGYAKIMEMFRTIGSKIGEDKFITSTTPGGGGGVMTKEQAVARKADLMKDAVWRDKYLKGDTAAAREMTALNRMIVS